MTSSCPVVRATGAGSGHKKTQKKTAKSRFREYNVVQVKRARAGVAIGIACAALIYGAFRAQAALFSPQPGELEPAGVSVAASASLPSQAQALEKATVGLAFDHNTTTQYTAFGHSHITTAFAQPDVIQTIKVYGPAPYTMRAVLR